MIEFEHDRSGYPPNTMPGLDEHWAALSSSRRKNGTHLTAADAGETYCCSAHGLFLLDLTTLPPLRPLAVYVNVLYPSVLAFSSRDRPVI